MAYMNPDGTYQSYVGAAPVQVIAPATGSTYTVPFGVRRLYVNTGALAALTVVVPKLPEAGMEITVNSKSAITALTWKDSSGTTISGLAGAAAANTPLSIVAVALTPGALPTWVRWN